MRNEIRITARHEAPHAPSRRQPQTGAQTRRSCEIGTVLVDEFSRNHLKGNTMKSINKVQTAAAGIAVLLALSACGGAATGTPASEDAKSKTSNTADISEGIQPDEAAVKLLPQSYKDKGELT